MICVNYDAIKQNAKCLKGKIGNKKLCAVVKNDAYGHGLQQVANAICDVVDMFAVGNVLEATKLLGLGKDVLVLLPPLQKDVSLAVSKGIVVTVDSMATLHCIECCAEKLNKPARVHLKLDTGMHRLGFDCNQLDDLIIALDSKYIIVEGVFSHFACADSDITFTDKQFRLFCDFSTKLEKSLSKNLVKHIANTAGTLADSKYHLDMVRVGLGLYGYGSSELVPAKTLLANVVAIKQLNPGDSVGYGARFVCANNTKVAVLDVGYADGFSRTFSCLHSVDINGNRCKQIGNVCMGMMMVDVTDVDVSVGDVAVLFGKNTTWNKNAFMYEALCNTR